MMYSLDDIYSIFRQCNGVTTDSRNVPEGSIFIGLKGDQFNGSLFAPDALKAGAAFAVVDDPSAQISQKCILVDDCLRFLQSLASVHRKKMVARVIGITGSNGKTTTKELIGAVLQSSYNTVMTQGNFNNHIGVPLTILSMTEQTEFAVIEMGANHPGEITTLCEIADPDAGIITNIGKAHLEGFGGYEGVIRAKSELYKYLAKKSSGIVFINLENELLRRLSEGMDRITYGTSGEAQYRGLTIQNSPYLSVQWIKKEEEQITIHSNLVGGYNFENIMAAVSIGDYFKVQSKEIRHAIESYVPSNNRSQMHDTGKNLLIMDAYNANPSSMKAALENFRSLPGSNKVVILGDMMELGDSAPEEHHLILDLLHDMDFKSLLLVGELFYTAAANKGLKAFKNITEAENYLALNPQVKKTILLKGSRKMQLEKLVRYL